MGDDPESFADLDGHLTPIKVEDLDRCAGLARGAVDTLNFLAPHRTFGPELNPNGSDKMETADVC